jgi:hypothetical protein
MTIYVRTKEGQVNRKLSSADGSNTPVVVIDPDDERAYRHIFKLTGWAFDGVTKRKLQEALRQISEEGFPEPVEEPNRLGAVVTDDQGHYWVKARTPGANPWYCQARGAWGSWSDINISDQSQIAPR